MNLYVMLVYAFFYRLYISVIFYTKYAMGQIKLVKKTPPLDYDKKLQIDAAKAATSATNDRQQLMSKLSVDVLKHLDKQRQPSKKEA